VPLLTAAEAQAMGVGLDLTETALQSVIDGEEAEMIRLFGPHGDGVTGVTATVRPRGGMVYLSRPIVSASAVSAASYPGGTPTTITDLYVWGNEGRVELYPSGWAWASWDYRSVVTLTYVPTDDRALRTSVLLSLTQAATEAPVSGGDKVSGLSFSIESGTTGTSTWDAARVAAYQRLIYFPVV
jgi:hypothetical protein